MAFRTCWRPPDLQVCLHMFCCIVFLLQVLVHHSFEQFFSYMVGVVVCVGFPHQFFHRLVCTVFCMVGMVIWGSFLHQLATTRFAIIFAQSSLYCVFLCLLLCTVYLCSFFSCMVGVVVWEDFPHQLANTRFAVIKFLARLGGTPR